MEDDLEFKIFNEVVDPRIAAEIISQCYLHCVLKGLHKAPRIDVYGRLSHRDINCLITPLYCYGPVHKACERADIPIIAVRENRTCLDARPRDCIVVENYHEAVGIIQAMKIGINYKED